MKSLKTLLKELTPERRKRMEDKLRQILDNVDSSMRFLIEEERKAQVIEKKVKQAKITFASDKLISSPKIRPIAKHLLKTLAHPEALVTDSSTLGDFISVFQDRVAYERAVSRLKRRIQKTYCLLGTAIPDNLVEICVLIRKYGYVEDRK